MLTGEDRGDLSGGYFYSIFLVLLVLPFCLLLHYVFSHTNFTERSGSPGMIHHGRKGRSESTFFGI